MNCYFVMKKIVVAIVLVLAVSFSAVAQQVDRKTLADHLLSLSYGTIELPLDYGSSVLKDVYLTEDAIEYVLVCKTEAIYNYCLLNYGDLKANQRTTFEQMSQSDELLSLIMLIDSEKNIKYNYYSPNGAKVLSVTFSNSDLLSCLKVKAVSPALREEAIRMHLSKIQALSPEYGFFSESINKKTISYTHRVDDTFEKGFKYNLRAVALEQLIYGKPDSVFPIYSLYLNKGYKYTLIDRNNKKLKSEISYKELAFMYSYAMEEQQKLLQEYAAREAMAAQAAKEAEGSDVANDEEGVPFQLIDKKPLFQGGDSNEFSRWVNERLVYPDVAKEYGVQGRVTLQFTVEKDGRVSRVKVLRGLAGSNSEEELERLYKELKNATTEQDINLIKENIGKLKGKMALDKEAVRVVSMSPKWLPGMLNDKPVPVTYTFPVIFQLR